MCEEVLAILLITDKIKVGINDFSVSNFMAEEAAPIKAKKNLTLFGLELVQREQGYCVKVDEVFKGIFGIRL